MEFKPSKPIVAAQAPNGIRYKENNRTKEERQIENAII